MIMMTTRKAAASRTRDALIQSGLRLAESTGLSGLSVNLIVEDASVSKGTFFHHFGDRTSYLLELHRDFHERLLAEILAVTDGVPAGAGRLLLAANTYLDVCLRDRGVRALLLEARAEPALAKEVSARNATTARLCKPDFVVMSWAQPLETARLWVALTAEAAIMELEAGRRKPTVRAAMAGFLAGSH